MADDILTTDRDGNDIDIAGKHIAGVIYPRNILTDPSGNDLTPLTDAALRATPVPVSVSGVASAANQATEIASLASIDAKTPALGQALAAASVPVVLTAAQIATLTPPAAITGFATETTLAATNVLAGAVNESAPGTDTASSGLNGRLQRIAQRLTSMIALLPAALGAGGGLKVDGSGTALPVSGTVAVTGVATEATLDARTGALTETAPASDTASSGINGRLQRIAQRITSLIALLPASLGPKAGSASLSVVEATPTTVTIVSLQTNATGTTYNAFGSQACEMLDLVNTAPSAVDLEVRRGGSGNTIVVPAGSSRMFVGLSNASDLQVRRLDQSNAQVTFTGEAVQQ